MRRHMWLRAVCAVAVVLAAVNVSWALSVAVTIRGSDAIYLAGRSDVIIPPLDLQGTFILARHNYTPPFPLDFVQETFPPVFAVAPGDVVRVANPAIGGINFYNGFGPPYYGPEGNNVQSSLTPLGGLSGWLGTQGPLAGVFLDNSIPLGGAAGTLDFWSAGTRDFTTLSPALGQVFFIGDGVNSGGIRQQFIAPAGATRIFLGIPDGFGFLGPPGAYEDNDGSYRIVFAINEEPQIIPEPLTMMGVALGLGALGQYLRRRRMALRG